MAGIALEGDPDQMLRKFIRRSTAPALYRKSTRRRRGSRKPAARSATQLTMAHLLNPRVQASDQHFFEQFTTAQRAAEPPAGDDRSASLRIDQMTISNDKQEVQDLYVEALYTIVHRVADQTGDAEQQKRYVQTAFDVDDQTHRKLLEKAKANKPPVLLLNVILLEARDLIAKDINGFSDPFSMLGVVPGGRSKDQPSPSPLDNLAHMADFGDFDEMNQKRTGSLVKRFGGSFRRRLSARKEKATNGNGGNENLSIPAKIIKASSVQKKTLNPKWNEKFQFVIDDPDVDRFHMDIWDHDDEDRSVLDAVTSLNQISGLKGLSRYFKEVTQSARVDSGDSQDDFLGCVNLKIKDIPSNGLEDWFPVEARSEKSEVSGQVKLKLWLSTREERQVEDELIDVKQHVQLLKQFAIAEIKNSKIPVKHWNGDLPPPALAILHQHAIQGDLGDVQLAMCRWLAYSSIIRAGISYDFLYATLQVLINKWVPTSLDKDEENMLADNFMAFIGECMKKLARHRQHFPANQNEHLERLSAMLKCLRHLRSSAIFEKCIPAQRSFESEITAIVVKSAEAYFAEILKRSENQDACGELLAIVEGLNRACASFRQYDPIFKTYAAVNYSEFTYREFDRLLDEYICTRMMSEEVTGLKCSLLRCCSQTDVQTSSVLLIRIHFALADFRLHRLSKTKYRMDRNEWGHIFDRAIAKFLDIARVKAFARVDLACTLDTPVQSTSTEIKHTSSHVDICHVIEQTVQIWERMEVSDVRLRADLTGKVVQSICKVAEYYVDKLFGQLAAEGFCGQLQTFVPAALRISFCCAINNAEQTRRALLINDRLRLDQLHQQWTQQVNAEDKWREPLERELDTCEQYIAGQIESAIERLVRRQTAQLKKHVFHLAWSPAGCSVEDALKPLTDALDNELSSVHRMLFHRNFVRFNMAQLNLLLPLLQECVDENPGLEPWFYQRLFEALSVLTDFFHAGGKGIALETFETIPQYQSLLSVLALNQSSTLQLIEQYYVELLKEQNEVNECKYGILNIRAYYNNSSKTLVVDVIGAKQIIPLDTNGLSDPFTVIELVPRAHFPDQPIAKTRIVYKTLNPHFDETFEFHIPPRLPPSAMLRFTVMDHDYLTSNDFAGEAYLDLTEVPGFTVNSSNSLRQFNLILIHPSDGHARKETVSVLTSRKEDKEAQDFVRTLSIVF